MVIEKDIDYELKWKWAYFWQCRCSLHSLPWGKRGLLVQRNRESPFQ